MRFPTSLLLQTLACSSLLLAGVGCDAAPDRPVGTVQVDTVDGTVITTNHGPGLWTVEDRWTVREFIRLGGRTEPEEQLFRSRAMTTSLGPEGNIYVLDFRGAQISVFEPDGSFVRTIGRRGRGPADFSAPQGMTWTPDGRLWVADPSNMKLAVFSPEGEFEQTYRRLVRPTARAQFPLLHVPGEGVIDEASDGRRLLLLRTSVSGEIRDTAAIIDRVGGPSDALMSAAVGGLRKEFRRVGYYYVSRMKWAVDPAGAVWVGSPEKLRFAKLDFEGDTLVIATADHRKSEFTPADERLIETAMRQSGLSRAQINPIRPIFQSMRVIDGGYLLVQLAEVPGEPSPRFDVYDSIGRYLGELDFGFAPTFVGTMGGRGDTLIVPHEGKLDVPYVIGVELVRPPPAWRPD